MASTSFRRVTSFNAYGYNVNLESRTSANFSRSNNSVSVTNASVDVRYANDSQATSFTGFNIVGGYSLPQGSARRDNTSIHSGTWNRGETRSTSDQSFSFTAGINDTSVSTNNGAGVNSAVWGGGQTLSIPALGSPAGTTSVDSFTLNSIKVRNNVTSWGANATAGTTNIDIADNSAFTGFWGASVSDNVPHTFGSLTPNTRYWMRGWQKNGGGKSAYSNTVNTVTLSGVYDGGTIEVSSASYSVTNARVYQGYYATSSKIQYRVKGTTTWSDSASASGDNISITITGLAPNTVYERRFVTTTTAGTTENPIVEFTTFPAAKIVSSDGSVQNAVARQINEDGSATMVDINIIEPAP